MALDFNTARIVFMTTFYLVIGLLPVVLPLIAMVINIGERFGSPIPFWLYLSAGIVNLAWALLSYGVNRV